MNSLNVEYLYTDALGVELKDNEKIVKTDKGDIICKNIIMSFQQMRTGLAPTNDEWALSFQKGTHFHICILKDHF